MKDFLKAYESGNTSFGQGYHCILDELNKNSKAWMYRGVSTDEMWLLVCRNNKFVKGIREHLKALHVTAKTIKSYKAILEKEKGFAVSVYEDLHT